MTGGRGEGGMWLNSERTRRSNWIASALIYNISEEAIPTPHSPLPPKADWLISSIVIEGYKQDSIWITIKFTFFNTKLIESITVKLTCFWIGAWTAGSSSLPDVADAVNRSACINKVNQKKKRKKRKRTIRRTFKIMHEKNVFFWLCSVDNSNANIRLVEPGYSLFDYRQMTNAKCINRHNYVLTLPLLFNLKKRRKRTKENPLFSLLTGARMKREASGRDTITRGSIVYTCSVQSNGINENKQVPPPSCQRPNNISE